MNQTKLGPINMTQRANHQANTQGNMKQANKKTARPQRALSIFALLSATGLALLLGGCANPMEEQQEEAMRTQIKLMNQLYSDPIADSKTVTLNRSMSSVESTLSPERIAELDAASGPGFYNKIPLNLGQDLAGMPSDQGVRLTLKESIRMAVENNLRSQAAKLLPAVAQAQIIQAESAFDAVFFTNVDQSWLDTPRPASPGFPTFGTQYSEQMALTTGIRKNLSTGGQVTAQTGFNRKFEDPSFYAPTGQSEFTYYEANLGLNITQPLLRGFGSDIARAEVMLAENAMDQSNQDVRSSLMQVAVEVETAYWNLVFARAQLRVLTDYSGKIKELRDILTVRGTISGPGFEGYDVEPADITEANARYDQSVASIIRARQGVRQASDQIKQLINNDQIPLASEVMIIPVDSPADAPIKYSLLDAVSVALRNRPEIKKALSQIDDSTIRTRVADNGRLPVLNATAGIRYNGLGQTIGAGYDTVTDANFIDYVIGMQFEVPIGNRGPEAIYTQARLARQGSVLNYQKTTQDVVLQVKSALRSLITNYELIGANREARRSAADSYRSSKQKFDKGEAYTPTFLDLLFRRAQTAAETQIQEAQSVASYNASIAQFYQAIGTLMEFNGITFMEDEPARRVSQPKSQPSK